MSLIGVCKTWHYRSDKNPMMSGAARTMRPGAGAWLTMPGQKIPDIDTTMTWVGAMIS
jgi:hypothetical protein